VPLPELLANGDGDGAGHGGILPVSAEIPARCCSCRGGAAQPTVAITRHNLPSRDNFRTLSLKMLIAKLDDDSFDIREQATAELIAIGPRARQQVEAAIQESHSAEIRRRLQDVLEALKKQSVSPECRRVITRLGELKTPESQTILKVLAAGNADPELVKMAKAALNRDTKKSAPWP
jgi:hypothetical protein